MAVAAERRIGEQRQIPLPDGADRVAGTRSDVVVGQ
jgi:hypothetical protein